METFEVPLLGVGFPDWFALLELPSWPPEEPEINASFKRLAALHHPDRGGDAEMFRKIADAKNTAIRWVRNKMKTSSHNVRFT